VIPVHAVLPDWAYGLADRACLVPNTVGTRFAIASGTKGLTALAVVSLINDDALAMSTTARSLLGTDLPLIGDDVAIEHLLAHRSGIGDYLDEEAGDDVTGYLRTVPPQDLATTEQYLAVLRGHPAKFSPGERFSYCNSGYVVLALIAERVSGVAFDQLVAERVCGPARMDDTGSCVVTSSRPGPRWVTCRPGQVKDERVPPADKGQRGRRDLLNGRRHQRHVAVAVHSPAP
jgi:CubicO group peptidase (beta-lactamase class C family)